MSKFLRCEGCEAEEKTDIGFDGDNIKRVVVAFTWPDKTDSNAFDLCKTCRDKLRTAADPKTWERTKAAA